MEFLKRQKTKVFILLFVAILLYPIPGFWGDKRIILSGVTQDSNLEEAGVNGVMDGSYFSTLNSYVENHFWGRNVLIKLRSQLMVSLFNESPNNNVVIGKDEYLFEPEYINKELNIYPVSDEDYFNELIEKLEKLDRICADHGKEMYIFLTPSKAYFCKDKIPDTYIALGSDGENNYQKFTRYLKRSNLKYFDAHSYIEENKSEIEAPVYYSTGIHWSHPWGQLCAKEFEEYVNSCSRWQLSEIDQKIKKKKNNIPDAPDADLYSSLNLIGNPNKDTYYKSKLIVTKENEVPAVFMRGGSFLGQSLRALGTAGAIHVTAHYENNYYFTNDYTGMESLSAFDAYDEFVDMGRYLSEADMLILEVNEAAIPNMSWGFIDYLIDNSELFER